MRIFILIYAILFGTMAIAQCPPNNFFQFETQQEVDDFASIYPNCTTLDLSITGNDINDLTPLSQLTEIESLSVFNTTQLVDFSGLENVVEAFNPYNSDLFFSNNTALISFNGLQNITNGSPTLVIKDNPLLTTLTSLSGISFAASPNGEYNVSENEISNNDSLINLKGLEAGIWGSILISDNDNLVSLSGLNLTTVSGQFQGQGAFNVQFGLKIINNDALQSLSALTDYQLNTGTRIEVSGNDSLTELGWDFTFSGCNRTTIITNNPLLSLCDDASTCLVVHNDGCPPNDDLSIFGNAPSCESEAVILKGCGILEVNNELLIKSISIFPNPTSEILNIETEASIILLSAKVLTVLGKKVLTSQSNVIDVSKLSSGIYFVEVSTNQGTLIKKIVKR